MGEHDPRTGFLPVCSLAPRCDEVATTGQQLHTRKICEKQRSN